MYLLFSCDEWKSYNSMRIRGVFTNERELRKVLIKLFEEGEFEFNSYYYNNELSDKVYKRIKTKLKNLSILEIEMQTTYISLQQINSNELI